MDWSDKEQVRAYNKAYHEANRDKHLKQMQAYNKTPKARAAKVAYRKTRPPAVVNGTKLWRKRHPEQARANAALQKAVRLKQIVKPEICTKCGTKGLMEGHHDDYSKPLEVEWLCRACHLNQHGKTQHIRDNIT